MSIRALIERASEDIGGGDRRAWPNYVLHKPPTTAWMPQKDTEAAKSGEKPAKPGIGAKPPQPGGMLARPGNALGPKSAIKATPQNQFDHAAASKVFSGTAKTPWAPRSQMAVVNARAGMAPGTGAKVVTGFEDDKHAGQFADEMAGMGHSTSIHGADEPQWEGGPKFGTPAVIVHAGDVVQCAPGGGAREVAPPKGEPLVKDLKRVPGIDNPYAMAWWMKGRKYGPFRPKRKRQRQAASSSSLAALLRPRAEEASRPAKAIVLARRRRLLRQNSDDSVRRLIQRTAR